MLYLSRLGIVTTCKCVFNASSSKILNTYLNVPRTNRFPSRHNATSSFTTLDSCDVELAYTIYPQDANTIDDSKTPLILLHGLFGAKGNMHSIAKHLASNNRKVITFDARNHGDSEHHNRLDYQCMSDDLEDLSQELQLGQPVVLGHSMGGKTAMFTALNKPESLSTLVVADVTPNQHTTSETDNLMVYAKAMKAAKLPQDQGLSQARKAAQVHLTPSIPNRGILSFLLTNIREYPNKSIKWRVNLDSIISNFSDLSSFPDLTGKSFSKPTLFVFGGDSYHYKSLDVGLVKQLFPSSEIEVVQGAGHFVHADKPLEFVNIVQEFLKTAQKDESGTR